MIISIRSSSSSSIIISSSISGSPWVPPLAQGEVRRAARQADGLGGQSDKIKL